MLRRPKPIPILKQKSQVFTRVGLGCPRKRALRNDPTRKGKTGQRTESVIHELRDRIAKATVREAQGGQRVPIAYLVVETAGSSDPEGQSAETC